MAKICLIVENSGSLATQLLCCSKVLAQHAMVKLEKSWSARNNIPDNAFRRASHKSQKRS
jgi:hypothetical protein